MNLAAMCQVLNTRAMYRHPGRVTVVCIGINLLRSYYKYYNKQQSQRVSNKYYRWYDLCFLDSSRPLLALVSVDRWAEDNLW